MVLIKLYCIAVDSIKYFVVSNNHISKFIYICTKQRILTLSIRAYDN